MVLTANSVSRCVSCEKRSARGVTRSDRVMCRLLSCALDRLVAESPRAGVRMRTGPCTPSAQPAFALCEGGAGSAVLLVVVELGAQQGAQARGTGVFTLAGLAQGL